ncbi:solute carrier family 22 member 7-like [Venturia canescens]|uniref:solute carrier family 22 member 7-like n=1 Tax=Venturia canescens TaxID=32260 RepID=UPI001C9D100C|nr:solute carrier family 22 member 7-like [Venturia canescens]
MNVEETQVGWFQILLLFLLSINYVIVSMSHALPVFQNYTPKFYCESSDGTNRTYGCLPSMSLPNASLPTDRQNQNNGDSCTNGYSWEAEITERSVVTDWSLICEKSYLIYLGPTVYYVGISIGASLAGILADRVGRLPVLAICLYIQGTMAAATYIVQSYPAFLVLRGLQGVFAQGLQNTSYILTLELFPKNFRTIVATTMELFWALGVILLAGLSHMIPDWRILQLAVSVPTAVTVLYIWIIPESPRWLLAKGKSTEADISLEKIVKYNGCCSRKNRQTLVAETESVSASSTPAKPERKSRLVRSDGASKDARNEGDEACELTNLLTPPNPAQRKSRRTSLRAITENLEKRLSNVELPSPEISVGEAEDTTCCDTPLDLATSSSNNYSEARKTSTNCETDSRVKNPEDDEVLIVRNSSTEIHNEEQNIGATKKEDTPDIEKVQEAGVNTRRNRFLSKYLIIMACQWFTASVTRGIFNDLTPELSKNRHVSFAIGGGLEMIAYVLTYFALSRYGRRIPMSLCQFVNCVVCITVGVIAVFTHSNIVWIGPSRIVFLLIGKISVVSLIATAYLFTVEIFPTVRRGACLGHCAITGMLGSLSSPHILSIRNHTTIAAPMSITGSLCLVSGLISLLLPETMNEALPDRVIQIGRTLTKNKIGVANCEGEKAEEEASKSEILREKLYSEDWVDAGNGIIVTFSENKN